MRDLEALMADKTGPYWHADTGPALQEESRRLIEARERGDSAVESGALPSRAARAQTAERLDMTVNEVATALRMTEALIADLAECIAGVDEALSGLDLYTRASMVRELGRGVPTARPATPVQLDAFSKTPAGQLLVREWGTDAGRKLVAVLAREQRLFSELDDAAYAEFTAFYRQCLQPREKVAILQRLAG